MSKREIKNHNESKSNTINSINNSIKEKQEFKLPERADDTKRVYAYLTLTRKLNPQIVNALFSVCFILL